MAISSKIERVTSSSTAEYFAKNLQQVGFSSPTKAVLTILKEAFDNALDACEDSGILPDIDVKIEKVGSGSLKNTDKLSVIVTDNGPGIDVKDLPRVFGEYLASSKFGRGRCSRGQQGIGISAATTWALQTTATGARVTSKVKGQKKAVRCVIGIDLKNNKGIFNEKESCDWDHPHGTSVEFIFDGRLQLNGEAGILNYLRGNVLVNPHLRLKYSILGEQVVVCERVSRDIVRVPPATEPHPHTMKLGDFVSHAKIHGTSKVEKFLKLGFSRISDKSLDDILNQAKLPQSILAKTLTSLDQDQLRKLFVGIQNTELRPPSTQSVLSIGEEGLSQSIKRLGEIDFFAVVSRKPTICDFKPVQVEVAIARLLKAEGDAEDPVQVLRFANRVPLQFDKAGCAIAKAITSVNWRSYGMKQARGGLPQGPFIFAVSVTSPFIKFKNAAKETIDSSDDLVEELRRALMQTGQKLSRHLKREGKEAELEEKLQYIEKFAPILVDTLVRITGASPERKLKAEEGLKKILGREAKETSQELADASESLAAQEAKEALRYASEEDRSEYESGDDENDVADTAEPSPQPLKAGAKKGRARPAIKQSKGNRRPAPKAAAGALKKAPASSKVSKKKSKAR